MGNKETVFVCPLCVSTSLFILKYQRVRTNILDFMCTSAVSSRPVPVSLKCCAHHVSLCDE